MTRYTVEANKPTATKERGAEWYYPAITVPYGKPMRLPKGDRYPTRGKAIAAARRILKERAMKEGQR